MMKTYSLGLDFGSSAVRALIVELGEGRVVGNGSSEYACGSHGVCTVPEDAQLARQNPDAYLDAMARSVRAAVGEARESDVAFCLEGIVGIGVDATASTPLPVTRDLVPLARLERFRDNLNAYSWMWKDHTAFAEAEEITALAAQIRPEYLRRCGGSYSSEWFWSKILHASRIDRAVFDAAYAWMEFADFVPAVLAGVDSYENAVISVCGAGHKAMFSDEWGGLPDAEFLTRLDPALAELRSRLYSKAYPSDKLAGHLCAQWAEAFGIPAGIPIAVGMIDAHSGAVGSGVGAGRMVSIIGTSGCDIMAAPAVGEMPDIPGICGIVNGSVLPGYFGFEGGQAAVGDSFFWQASTVCGIDPKGYAAIEREAGTLKPGASGLVALDWLNGNRNPYCDPQLSGLMLGMTLHTTPAELYRAWIEAAAYGVRQIVELLRGGGVEINEIICCGGIPEKSSLLMQIYADVLQMPLRLPESKEACALGAAVFGAVVGGAFPNAESAQTRLCRFRETTYHPIETNSQIYNRLYQIYLKLGTHFSKSQTMKELNALRFLAN